jgi:phospholipase C
MLVVSPYSRSNYVDNSVMDQSSVVQFIEQNWSLQPMGNGAADTNAGSLDSMFDFSAHRLPPVFLSPSSGEVVGHRP